MTDGCSFAILGGYGQLGRVASRILVPEGAAAMTIAGRNADKARSAAAELSKASSANVGSRETDADDAEGLADLLARHDVLIHAAPLCGKATEALLTALLRTEGRTVVVGHDTDAVDTLRSARDDLLAGGATVILDAGADPGLPGLVGHLAAGAYGSPEAIEIAARYRAPEIGRAGLDDILESASDAAWIYDSAWRRAGSFEIRRKSYPGGIGSSLALPVRLPELDVLVEYHDLELLALWHGGLNGLSDLVVTMYRMVGKSLPRSLFVRGLELAASRFNPPPYGIGISAKATAPESPAQYVELAHEDVYEATAEVAGPQRHHAGWKSRKSSRVYRGVRATGLGQSCR